MHLVFEFEEFVVKVSGCPSSGGCRGSERPHPRSGSILEYSGPVKLCGLFKGFPLALDVFQGVIEKNLCNVFGEVSLLVSLVKGDLLLVRKGFSKLLS